MDAQVVHIAQTYLGEEDEVTLVNVRLSRRNLEQLLKQLDDSEREAFAGIARTVSDSLQVHVLAQENDDHYGERTPGRVFNDESGL